MTSASEHITLGRDRTITLDGREVGFWRVDGPIVFLVKCKPLPGLSRTTEVITMYVTQSREAAFRWLTDNADRVAALDLAL